MSDFPHFRKGQSGNPGGRPKVPPEVKALLQERTLTAMQKLCGLLESKDEKIVLAAATAILDRALGKPSQSVVHSGDEDNPVRTLQEISLRAIDAIDGRPPA